MFFNPIRALILGALFVPSILLADQWNSKEWLRLGRYHKSLFGFKSEADGPGFFLHPKGKYRPDLEYQSLLKGVQATPVGDHNNHAICRFPARTNFLIRQNSQLKLANVHCEKFEKFKERVSAKSVSLVFSSYYLNNPASSFGHTFIRLGKNEFDKTLDGTTTELLDMGINYGASTGDANALTYILGAFVGYFYGTYNSIPYYYKVREYNDFESRDLWTYHLDFNLTEIDQLVRHIWELGHGEFRYYFLTENCSYHALTMLETIRPELDLVSDLPDNYIIPTDTLKVVVKKKIVRDITYRPSASTNFYQHLEKLDQVDRQYLKDILAKKELPHDLSEEKKAFLHDSALALVDYKYAKEILTEDKEAQAIKRPILNNRSKIPIRSKDFDFSNLIKNKPHEGHDSGRLCVGGSEVDGKSFINLGYRFAFHDFIDYQKAYLPHSRVEMGSFKATANEKKITLTDVALADYYSLGSFDEYTKSFSWKLKFGGWQTFQKGVDGYATYGAIAGYGYSYSTRFFTPFLLASFESSYVNEAYHKVKFAYGADLGFLIDFNDHFRFSSFYEQRFHPWEETFSKNELRLSNVHHALSLFYHVQAKQGFNEVGLNYFIYLK